MLPIDGSLITVILAIIAGAGAMAWRMWSLEQFVKERARESREDRKVIYSKLDNQATEMSELKGYLRGRGMLNGSD